MCYAMNTASHRLLGILLICIRRHFLFDSYINFDLLQVAAYDTVAKKMAFFEPSRSQDFLFISGTKVRVFITFIVREPMLYASKQETITFC